MISIIPAVHGGFGRFRVTFGDLAACSPCQPWADYTISMFEFEFPQEQVFVSALRNVAGCAKPTRSAATMANLKLTFHPGHSVGADQ